VAPARRRPTDSVVARHAINFHLIPINRTAAASAYQRRLLRVRTARRSAARVARGGGGSLPHVLDVVASATPNYADIDCSAMRTGRVSQTGGDRGPLLQKCSLKAKFHYTDPTRA